MWISWNLIPSSHCFMTRTSALPLFWIRVTVMSMHFSSLKSWISMPEEVSQIIKIRESLSSQLFENLGWQSCQVVENWKGKKKFLGYEFLLMGAWNFGAVWGTVGKQVAHWFYWISITKLTKRCYFLWWILLGESWALHSFSI